MCVSGAGLRALIFHEVSGKDRIQTMSWHIIFSVWACRQEYLLPLLTLFCYQIGSKINKKMCDLSSESCIE